MEDLSLDEISSRIIDAVMDERHIDRKSLYKIIRPILKIWIKQSDRAKKTGHASIDKLRITIENKELQQKYWLGKLRELVGSENIQAYYDELDKLLIEGGYK